MVVDVLSLSLAIGGLLLVITGWLSYLATIHNYNVPRRPYQTLFLTITGGLLGLAAVMVGDRQVATLALAALDVSLGFGFPLLLTQRKTPLGRLQITVGDKLLSFSAMTSDGQAFRSEQFEGTRVLLKFFRGHW